MQFTWNGSTGSYTDAVNWTPQGVPLYNNDASALIQAGTAILTSAEPNGVDIVLSGPNAGEQPTLVLDNAALGPGVRLALVPPSVDGRSPRVGTRRSPWTATAPRRPPSTWAASWSALTS